MQVLILYHEVKCQQMSIEASLHSQKINIEN